MPSIGYMLGDSAFDATVKSLKSGHGLGPVGGALGGIVKGIGGLALGGAELTGKGAIGGAGFVGKSLINSVKGNPFAAIGAVATGAAIGHTVADLDGQADTKRTAINGALFATGAATFGGAGLVSGLGMAGAGAAMMGVNALGTVGSSMLSVKTKGEKYNELYKEFQGKSKGLSGKKLQEASKDFGKQLKSTGAEAGSMEEMDIGLGNLNDFKLNKGVAVPMIMGAAAIKGIAGGVKAFEKSRMGMNDGRMRSATPDLPTPDQTMITSPGNPTYNSNSYYANNAGATGDLVFALHKNR